MQHGVDNTLTTRNRNNYDYYGTPPQITQYLLNIETFQKDILEPCAGQGYISQYLENKGYNVTSMDIQQNMYPKNKIQNFLTYNKQHTGDIITNPPYSKAIEFVTHTLKICTGKIAMLLKLQFLETIQRYEKIFKNNPPQRVHIFVKRVNCIKKDNTMNGGGSYVFCVVCMG